MYFAYKIIKNHHPLYHHSIRLKILFVLTLCVAAFVVAMCLSYLTNNATSAMRYVYVPELDGYGENNANSSNRTAGIAKRLPRAIIIGTRKGGTRALLKFLELNPRIRAAQSEVHFFDKDDNYVKGLDWYRDQMPSSESDAQLTIEKSPAYFVTRQAPARIQSMDASVKLVLILRDPVERLVSDYSQLIANRIDSVTGYSKLTATNESLWREAEAKLEAYVTRPSGSVNEQNRMVRTGMYAMHLEWWRNYFPLGIQLHLVDGERLIAGPASELNKLELFLGLEPQIRDTDFVFEPRKGFYCIAQTSTAKLRAPSAAKSELSHERLGPHSYCLSKNKGRRHVKLARELRRKLELFYEPHNEYLFSLANRRFNWTSMSKSPTTSKSL